MAIEKDGIKVVIIEKVVPTERKFTYAGTEPPYSGATQAIVDPEGRTCDNSNPLVYYVNPLTGVTEYYRCSHPGFGGEIKELRNTNGDLIHKRITATFDANGGSNGSSQTRTWGVEQIVTPPTPYRSGHDFNGWYTAASGGTRIYFPTGTPQNDITFYAQWSVSTQTLKWAYNGSSSTKVCFCGGYNPIGNSCSFQGETMVICGADIGESEQCSKLICVLS